MARNNSHTKRNRVLAVVVASAFVVSAGFAVGASHEGTTPDVSGSVVAQPWNFEGAPSESVSKAGVAISARIEKARDEIKEGFSEGTPGAEDVTGVSEDLAAAVGELETILDASPAVRIKGQIYAAAMGIPAGEEDAVVASLGAIQNQLAELPNWPSVEQARSHVKTAKVQLESGEKEAAFESLKAADGSVVLGSGDIPAAETYYLVNVALAALAQQDADTAGKALEAAQQSADAFVAEVSSTTQVVSPAAARS